MIVPKPHPIPQAVLLRVGDGVYQLLLHVGDKGREILDKILGLLPLGVSRRRTVGLLPGLLPLPRSGQGMLFGKEHQGPDHGHIGAGKISHRGKGVHAALIEKAHE